MHILTLDALTEVAWKNGGGTTREIATGRVADSMIWRISRADVAQDGAFSDFTGMMRILTVVSGGGMVLTHANGALEADLWVPVRFDGGVRIQSHLKDGPLTDLNLMFDPDLCVCKAIPHRGPFTGRVERPRPGLIAFHVLAGAPVINDARLMPGDTAFVETCDAALTLVQDDAVLELRLSYLDQTAPITLCLADRPACNT